MSRSVVEPNRLYDLVTGRVVDIRKPCGFGTIQKYIAEQLNTDHISYLSSRWIYSLLAMILLHSRLQAGFLYPVECRMKHDMLVSGCCDEGTAVFFSVVGGLCAAVRAIACTGSLAGPARAGCIHDLLHSHARDNFLYGPEAWPVILARVYPKCFVGLFIYPCRIRVGFRNWPIIMICSVEERLGQRG